MAKAKTGLSIETVKKHYFWIVVVVVLLVSCIVCMVARGNIRKKFNDRKAEIEAEKKAVDEIAANSKHPNNQTISDIKSHSSALKDSVFEAWNMMYSDQKMRNRWPVQLSRELLDLVQDGEPDKVLKFRAPIGVGKPYLLEDYALFIGNHLPELLQKINRRRCQVKEYKLLQKADYQRLGLADAENREEKFWPVLVDPETNGLYILMYEGQDEATGTVTEAFDYDLKRDVVSVIEDSTRRETLRSQERTPYYREVDPWITDPKDYMEFGLASAMGSEDAMGMGMMGDTMGGMGMMPGMGGMGGTMGTMGGMGMGMGGAGGMGATSNQRNAARGSMGMGGMGDSFNIEMAAGDGIDPAEDQVPGTSLEELGGGSLGGLGGGKMTGGTGTGAMPGMGGGRGGTGAMPGMGGGRGGTGAMPGMGGGRGGMMGGGRGGMMGGMGGMSGGLGSGSSNPVADNPEWAQQIYPGLPPYKERRRIVGNVDWLYPEVYQLPTWDQGTNPESIEVWYAQETLWVYEALIRIIAETNKDSETITQAPVKCVEEMLIGQNAGMAWLTLSSTIGDLTGASAMTSSMMMMGSTKSGTGSKSKSKSSGKKSNTEEGKILEKILYGRYLDGENKPLVSTEAPPFAEFNKMPICLKLIVDQRQIPELLVNCANSSMPIDIKHVRISPDNNIPFTMPNPNATNASDMMGMMGMGMMSGMGAGGDAAGGGKGGGKSGSGARGSMSGSDSAGMGMGMDGGVDVGRSEISQSEYGADAIRVEIYGIINIFNEPNLSEFGTGEETKDTKGVKMGDSDEDEDTDTDTNATGTESGTGTTVPTDSSTTPDSTATVPADNAGTDTETATDSAENNNAASENAADTGSADTDDTENAE